MQRRQFRAVIGSQINRLARYRWALSVATMFAAGGAALYYVAVPRVDEVGARIEYPVDNTTVTDADDASGCADGYQTEVRVRTNAPDGTTAVLTANGLRVGSAAASSGLVTFTDVQLGSREDHVLVAQVGDARAVSNVRVRCAGHRTCKLLGPTWSPEHPAMNAIKLGVEYDAGADADAEAGVTWAAIGGGDSYSTPGDPYQIRVQGKSTIAAGGRYEVFVDGSSTGWVAKSNPGSEVTIAGVPLSTEGSHTVALKCIDADNAIGFSSKATFVVDTHPPQLAHALGHGPRFSSSMLINGRMRVCASTTSGDAVDLPELARATRLNFCAGVGTSTPACTAVATHGADELLDAGVNHDGATHCDGAVACACNPEPPPCGEGFDASVSPLTGTITCYPDAGSPGVTNTLACNGCPVGTTLTPGTVGRYSCRDADGGVVWSGSIACTNSLRLPDGDAGVVTWDAGCYSCPNDGGAACLNPWTAGIDGGCRECQYQLADGGVQHTGWQCPTCHDPHLTANGGCVELDCPGPAPFALRLSLYDGARNVTTRIVEQVTCEVAGPSIEIVDPIGGSNLEIVEDIAKRVLASSTGAAPRRDVDPVTPGAQYHVFACTDAPAGTTARLFAGLRGRTMTEIATTSVVDPSADAGVIRPCPYGKTRWAVFASATIPESGEDGLGRLSLPTDLRVDMAGADGGTASSPLVSLWVDTTPPAFAFEGNVCGQTFPQDAAPNVRVRTNTLPVTVKITTEQGTSSDTITEFAPDEYN